MSLTFCTYDASTHSFIDQSTLIGDVVDIISRLHPPSIFLVPNIHEANVEAEINSFLTLVSGKSARQVKAVGVILSTSPTEWRWPMKIHSSWITIRHLDFSTCASISSPWERCCDSNVDLLRSRRPSSEFSDGSVG